MKLDIEETSLVKSDAIRKWGVCATVCSGIPHRRVLCIRLVVHRRSRCIVIGITLALVTELDTFTARHGRPCHSRFNVEVGIIQVLQRVEMIVLDISRHIRIATVEELRNGEEVRSASAVTILISRSFHPVYLCSSSITKQTCTTAKNGKGEEGRRAGDGGCLMLSDTGAPLKLSHQLIVYCLRDYGFDGIVSSDMPIGPALDIQDPLRGEIITEGIEVAHNNSGINAENGVLFGT
jgi:hypothetical protein